METRRRCVERPCVWRESDTLQRARWVFVQPVSFHQCHQASQCSGGYLSFTDSGSAAAHQPRTLWDPSYWQKDQPWRPALLTGCVSVFIQTSRPTWTRRDPNCDFLFPHSVSLSLPPCLVQGWWWEWVFVQRWWGWWQEEAKWWAVGEGLQHWGRGGSSLLVLGSGMFSPSFHVTCPRIVLSLLSLLQ